MLLNRQTAGFCEPFLSISFLSQTLFRKKSLPLSQNQFDYEEIRNNGSGWAAAGGV